MAEPHIMKFTITDLGNPKIQADVPETQIIRQPTEDAEFADTFTPILKVTKTETTFTKGYKKLQKVTVSEEAPPSYLNPVFSEVQSEVLPTQPVRDRIATFNDASKKEEPKQQSKTRIPIKKFKETVNRINQRRSSKVKDPDSTQVSFTPGKERKSSIPKLKTPQPNTEGHHQSADEEFDKIFEEIVDNNNFIDSVEIEDATIDDPVSLDYCFDEIAQAYNKDELKPIEITNNNVDVDKTATEAAKLKELTKTTKEIGNDYHERTATKVEKLEKIPNVTNFKEMPVIKLSEDESRGIKPIIETIRFEKPKDDETITKNTDIRKETGIKRPIGDNIPDTNLKPQTNNIEKAKIIEETKPNETKKTVYTTDKNEIKVIETNYNNNSKIPLGRFKSVQEVKVPKNTVRRRSLKSETDEDVVKVKKIVDDGKEKRDITEKVKVKNIVIDQNNSKIEKEAKAQHKELVRNILKTNDVINSVNNISENEMKDKSENPKLKYLVKDENDTTNIKKLEENIIIEGEVVQYNKNEPLPDISVDGKVNLNTDKDNTENDKKFSEVAVTVKRVVSKLKSEENKNDEPSKETKANVMKEINLENTKLIKEKTPTRDTVLIGDFKPEIIKVIENIEPVQSESPKETTDNVSNQTENVVPIDIKKDLDKPLHIYEKYTDLPRGFLANEPKKIETIKKKNVSTEGQLRLKKLSNQFDDVSYKDERKQADMTPVNTPIENKVAFNDMSQSSLALVKNAVVILKKDEIVNKKEILEYKTTPQPENNVNIIGKKDTKIISNNHKAVVQEPKTAKPMNKVHEIGADKNENVTKNTDNNNVNERPYNYVGDEIVAVSNIKGPDFTDAHASNDRGTKDEEIKPKQEIPKKRSVLSKIAMFERNEPLRQYQPKPPKIVDDNTDKKPIIVDEVLKTRIIREKSVNGEDILIKENIAVVPDANIKVPVEINLESKGTSQVIVTDTVETVDTNVTNAEAKETKEDNLKTIETAINIDIAFNPIETVENKQITTEVKESKTNENKNKKLEAPKDDKPNKYAIKRFEKKPIYKSVENLSKRYEKVNSNTDLATKNADENYYIRDNSENNDRPRLYRAKSLADIELGEVLVGKVELVVKNIEISSEKEREKKAVINVRERPRKRSVADKIAIFEKKIISIEIDDAKPKTQNQNSITDNEIEDIKTEREQEIRKRIDDLLTAKLRYKSVENVPYLKLNDGTKMPVLALGTALIEPSLVRHVVCAAIDLGYRAIDTAYIYGNEKEVGEGIRAKIADGTVKREDLYIMSKLWSTFHRPDLVEKACNHTLDALGLEYLDLFMIHNPMSFKEGPDPIPKIANVIQYSEFEYLDAWHAMENLVRKGLVKSIGVSNFNAEQIDRVLDKGRIKPVVNQVECQPYLSQHRLSAHCRSRAIVLSCYGVLGSKGTPEEHKSAGSQPVIDDVNVRALAKDLAVTPARILIRYQLEKGNAIVTKCSSSAHLKDILDALDMKLSSHEMDVLDGLNQNQRNFNFKGMGDTHRNYPFKKQF